MPNILQFASNSFFFFAFFSAFSPNSYAIFWLWKCVSHLLTPLWKCLSPPPHCPELTLLVWTFGVSVTWPRACTALLHDSSNLLFLLSSRILVSSVSFSTKIWILKPHQKNLYAYYVTSHILLKNLWMYFFISPNLSFKLFQVSWNLMISTLSVLYLSPHCVSLKNFYCIV